VETTLGRVFEEAGCAGSVHAVRLSDGVEVGYEADRPQVLASVVKVPIGLEFYAQADAGALDPTVPMTLLSGMRTPGPVGISQFHDPVVISLRDLSHLMLTISDNAATDAVTTAVGIHNVNQRLQALGCHDTVVVETIQAMLDGVAAELGADTYEQLVTAQRGDRGPQARAATTDPARIERCRALDLARTSRTTARDATRLLAAIWADTAASRPACAQLRDVMAQQVTRRLGPAVPEGGTLAAKSGALFGRVRNEIGVITHPDGETYAVAVLTRAHRPFRSEAAINAAMATAAAAALDELHHR
jgi:beta-lactamase class A